MKHFNLKKTLGMAFLLVTSFTSWAQRAEYCIIKDGMLNGCYAVLEDDDPDGAELKLGKGPDGKNCAILQRYKEYTGVTLDLSNYPIDLSKSGYLYIEYALPEDAADKNGEIFEQFYEGKHPYIGIALLNDIAKAEEASSFYSNGTNCRIDAKINSQANVYKKDFKQIFYFPSDTIINAIRLNYVDLYEGDAFMYIKNLYICSNGTSPFYAENFDPIGTVSYADNTNAGKLGNDKFTGNKSLFSEERITLRRSWQEGGGNYDGSEYLDDELLHGLDINESGISIGGIAIPNGCKKIYANSLFYKLWSWELSDDNTPTCKVNAMVEFDNGTLVPLFKDAIISDIWWEEFNDSISVPNGAKYFSVEFNPSSSNDIFEDNIYAVDNLQFSTGRFEKPKEIDFSTATWFSSSSYTNFSWDIDESGDAVITGIKKRLTDSIVVPEVITRVQDGIEYKVTSIADGAFKGSQAFSITLPNSIKSIGSSAFSNCSNLTSVTIPNSVTEIYRSTFSGCSGLTSITIPNSVTSIGDGAFEYCSGLTSITIPNSVTEIGSYAFSGCNNLTSITIPNSVTEIGEDAFLGCNNLTSITIPNGVTEIVYDAFRYCSNLKELIFTGTLVEWISNDRYRFCNLVDTKSTYGVIIVEGKNLREMTSITIPNSVTEIGSYAFHGCSNLKELIFTGTLAEWVSNDRYRFYDIVDGYDDETDQPTYGAIIVEGKNLREMTSITIPNGVTEIGEEVFYNCSSLTSVTIPSGVTTIGEDAFYGCKSLSNITIPASVKEIETGAFNGCTNLKKVTCLAKVPPMVEDYDSYATFGNYNAYLYIPCDNQEDYDLHSVWGKFKYIRCIEASQTEEELTDVAIEPGDQNANFAWPSTENASTYSLTISKDGEVFCTLLFNANGQLTSIDFSGLKSASMGFQFNVTGLKDDSEYAYSLEAKDKSGKALETYTGTFKTLKSGTTDVDDMNVLAAKVSVSYGTINVNADANDVVSIYNAQSQRLYSKMGSATFQAPSTGVYLVVCGNQSAKVLVK